MGKSTFNPSFLLANGTRVPIEVTQRMDGVQVSATIHWCEGSSPQLPEEWDGYDADPVVGTFEHAQGEQFPRPITTVKALQELAYHYNEVEGAVRWVSLDLV